MTRDKEGLLTVRGAEASQICWVTCDQRRPPSSSPFWRVQGFWCFACVSGVALPTIALTASARQVPALVAAKRATSRRVVHRTASRCAVPKMSTCVQSRARGDS